MQEDIPYIECLGMFSLHRFFFTGSSLYLRRITRPNEGWSPMCTRKVDSIDALCNIIWQKGADMIIRIVNSCAQHIIMGYLRHLSKNKLYTVTATHIRPNISEYGNITSRPALFKAIWITITFFPKRVHRSYVQKTSPSYKSHKICDKHLNS